MLVDGTPLRRLFSTFAQGWPGVGLLLMRLVAGTAVIVRAVRETRIAPAGIDHCWTCLRWLPESFWWRAYGRRFRPGWWRSWESGISLPDLGDPWANILLATIGAALALLGPGAWSVDARLFGWKRIHIHDRGDSRPLLPLKEV